MPLRIATSLILLLSLAISARAEDCMSDWGTAGEIVRTQGLRTVEQIAKASKGQIVKATLCKEGGKYIYRLVVRDGAGQLKNVVLSASDHASASNSP